MNSSRPEVFCKKVEQFYRILKHLQETPVMTPWKWCRHRNDRMWILKKKKIIEHLYPTIFAIPQNLQENTCVSASFLSKAAEFRPATLSNKRFEQRYFFQVVRGGGVVKGQKMVQNDKKLCLKFFRKTLLQNTSGRLLLWFPISCGKSKKPQKAGKSWNNGEHWYIVD